LPALMEISPPWDESPSPTISCICPPRPEVAELLDRMSDPELPMLDVPDENAILPLLPSVPALCVLS
jgi:hypothetical protein